jgi:hypothetical protein
MAAPAWAYFLFYSIGPSTCFCAITILFLLLSLYSISLKSGTALSAVQSHLCLHINIWINFSISVENVIAILIRISLNLHIAFDSIINLNNTNLANSLLWEVFPSSSVSYNFFLQGFIVFILEFFG